MAKTIAAFFLFIISASAISQERQISVPFNQPPELSGSAGNDLNIYADHAYVLGNSIELAGGTPEYIYKWATPALDTVLNQTLIIVNSTGTFYLIVTDANNCTFKDPLTVSYITSADNPGQTVTRIFPNPVNECLHYRVAAGNSPAQITLLSLRGDIILEKTIPGSSAIAEGDLDVRHISPGSYIVTIKTALSEYYGKIVIMR